MFLFNEIKQSLTTSLFEASICIPSISGSVFLCEREKLSSESKSVWNKRLGNVGNKKMVL